MIGSNSARIKVARRINAYIYMVSQANVERFLDWAGFNNYIELALAISGSYRLASR